MAGYACGDAPLVPVLPAQRRAGRLWPVAPGFPPSL